jgi:hypothetical protein
MIGGFLCTVVGVLERCWIKYHLSSCDFGSGDRYVEDAAFCMG